MMGCLNRQDEIVNFFILAEKNGRSSKSWHNIKKKRYAICFRSTFTISQTIFQVSLATFYAKFQVFTTPYLFQIWRYVLLQSSFGDSKGQSFDACSHFQFIPNIRKNSCVISFCSFFYSHVVRIITFMFTNSN